MVAWGFQLLLWAHILLGSMALFLFWIPIFSRKGGIDHRKFGRYFTTIMYTVALSGAMMGAIAILSPDGVKPQQFNADTTPEYIFRARLFWAFLVYLSLITFISVRQGNWALRVSAPRSSANISFMLPVYCCACAGLVFVVIGVALKHPLYIPFGILGLAISIGVWRYTSHESVTKSMQVVEHLGGLIGSGIAAYTAFFSFGMRAFLPTDGLWQLAGWIAPGVIGSIYIRHLSRQYRQAS